MVIVGTCKINVTSVIQARGMNMITTLATVIVQPADKAHKMPPKPLAKLDKVALTVMAAEQDNRRRHNRYQSVKVAIVKLPSATFPPLFPDF